MPTVKLLTATHIHALPGVHSVSDAECTRLCALGVAEPCAVVEIDAKELAEYAKIPSRDGLLTMLAGGLIGTVRDLSICLDLYSQQKEEN